MATFEPIAVVGQGCVLPGAPSPQELWTLVHSADHALGELPAHRWTANPDDLLTSRDDWTPDHIWTDRGGFVRDFALHLDDPRISVDSTQIEGLDPLFLWTLEAARQALADLPLPDDQPIDGGLILGNKMYPTTGLADYADAIWQGLPDHERPPKMNRYMAGLPAPWVAQSLGFTGPSYALDTACASSLYAIHRACRQLQMGRADLMLAGGVNATDDLFLRAGFCSLQAMSDSAQCRPFHRHADGLLPAEGAAIVALKRLPDARRDGDTILAVIRGVGLSNDGHSRGLLTPSQNGQIRAIEDAYRQSGLDPASVSMIECHAAGTPLGDATEVQSLAHVFSSTDKPIPIASLKSNLGHLITVSGAAALLKCLAAIHHRRRPPSLHADDPIDELHQSPHLRLLHTTEDWPSDGPRRCGINNFGFGGNNAHLLIEEHLPDASITPVATDLSSPKKIAVIGLHTRCQNRTGPNALDPLFTAQRNAHVAPSERHGAAQIDLKSTSIPPRDLDRAMPQQLLALEAAQKLDEIIRAQDPARTGVAIGIEVDAEICRYISRWRHGQDAVDDGLPAFDASSAMGTMPNLVTNRINRQFDLTGPSLTVAAGEASGTVALQESLDALRQGDLQAAIVGAVDAGQEPVHRSTRDGDTHTADAAVMMVLKPLDDARSAGDDILAIIDDSPPRERTPDFTLSPQTVTAALGDTHTAAGLLTVAALIEATRRRLTLPDANPWLPRHQSRLAIAQITPPHGPPTEIAVKSPIRPKTKAHVAPSVPHQPPHFATFSAPSRAALIDAIEGQATPDGPHRLAIVADNPDHLREQQNAAIDHLKHHALSDPVQTIAPGLYAGDSRLVDDGEVAFVFTGPAGAYPQMGRHLITAFPDLVDRFARRTDEVPRLAQWIYDADPDAPSTEADQLWGASFLCQIHAQWTQSILGIEPHAAIGFCAGETNALFALGAWNDVDDLYDDLDHHHIFDRLLGGRFDAARDAWGDDLQWETWRVLAPMDDVAAACADEERCALTIINAPGDLIIAGHAPACRRVIDHIGHRRARQLGYNMSLHCAAAEPARDLWLRLHHRPTTELASPRFYSLALQDHYQPTAQGVAQALVGQAFHQVDFPSLIDRAHDDGVRIFIEHGPRSGCTRWINRILGDRPHFAVALDRRGQSSLRQAIDASARLWAAGLHFDPTHLAERLDALHPSAPSPPPSTSRAFPLHLPPMAIRSAHQAFQLPKPPPLPPTTSETKSQDPIAAAHQAFLQHRADLHQRFLEQQKEALQQLLTRRKTSP